MDALWEIIDRFRENMSEQRFDEMLRRIFVNSPYVRVSARGNAQTLVLEPYFAHIVEAYDRSHKPAARKKAAPAATPSTKTRARKAPSSDETK